MLTKRSLEGYLLIDHRNSPGVSEELIQTSGLDAPIVGAGKTFEAATIRCAHCGTHFLRNPARVRERGYCQKCDHYICDYCSGKECNSFKKQLDDIREQAFKLIGKG